MFNACHEYENNSGTNNYIASFINTCPVSFRTGKSLFKVMFLAKNVLTQRKNAEIILKHFVTSVRYKVKYQQRNFNILSFFTSLSN